MFRSLSLSFYCFVFYAAFIIQKENIVICFVINITLEIQWEKIISCKRAYKVAWFSLTCYLKPKARPLSVKKKVQKIFLLFFLYAQVRIHGRYFYILLIYFLCVFFFWLWKCSDLHTMSWQTELFLILKRNHYCFF